jgi:hypothetical protein
VSDEAFIAQLEERLARARAEGDRLRVARLTDQIARLRGASAGSAIRVQQPGKMGLGSSTEEYAAKRPAPTREKPDPMTAGHKPGGRRKR